MVKGTQSLSNMSARILARLIASLVLFTLASPLSVAQEAGEAGEISGAALSADLSRTLQGHARAALGRHLRAEEFQAFAKATANDSVVQPLPYLPETLAPIAGPEATPESLAPFLKRVEIEVLIADRYDDAAKAELKTILLKSLALDEARGDKVTFSSFSFQVERPESAVARDLARTEADARSTRAQLDQVVREREDAKRESSDAKQSLSQAKTELERLERENLTIKSAKDAKEASKEDNDRERADTTSSQPADRGFWRENATLIIAALIALLAIFAASATLRGASRVLSGAVQSIGSGMAALGEKLSEPLSRNAQALLPAADSRSRLDESESSPQAMKSLGATMPIEAVAKRVLELHDEMLGAVNESNQGLVLAHLSYLLDDDAQIGLAVGTMELLGKEKANELYNRLAVNHQQKVFAFLKTGSHTRPKGEVMLEAGEALKTKLFGASFSNRAQLGAVVSEKLLQLSVADQVAVARGLEGETLARFFLYLEPSQLGLVLSRLREKDPKRFDRVVPMVIKIPEVEAAKNLDHEVAAAIAAQHALSASDVQGPYLTYYKALVESVEDEVAESLAEHLAAASPRVERFIRETIVTFGTFFKLHGDLQEEIVAGTNNKDLAAVVSMLKPEHKSAILAHVEERRRELIDEEGDRLTTRGLRHVTAAHRSAKKQIVSRIIQAKGEGPLSALLAQPAEGLAAPASRPGSRAA